MDTWAHGHIHTHFLLMHACARTYTHVHARTMVLVLATRTEDGQRFTDVLYMIIGDQRVSNDDRVPWGC